MTNEYGRQQQHEAWTRAADQRIGDAQQRVLALLNQRENEARLHQQRLAEAAERRRQEEAAAEARDDQLAAGAKQQARMTYFAQHPYATDESFAAYWKRVKPDRAALHEAQVNRVVDEMRARGHGRI
jgi:hypothetical protein